MEKECSLRGKREKAFCHVFVVEIILCNLSCTPSSGKLELVEFAGEIKVKDPVLQFSYFFFISVFGMSEINCDTKWYTKYVYEPVCVLQ